MIPEKFLELNCESFSFQCKLSAYLKTAQVFLTFIYNSTLIESLYSNVMEIMCLSISYRNDVTTDEINQKQNENKRDLFICILISFRSSF